MNEHALKHTSYAYNLKLKFSILKDSLSALQKLPSVNKLDIKPKKENSKTIEEELEDEIQIPKYMTL